MNEQNYEYLSNQLFYTGFGKALEKQLKERLEAEESEFELYYKTGNNYENLTAELRFSQSKQTDLFFFNSFRLELMRKNFEAIRSQVFYMNPNYHFTLKEAYNLLRGRSVKKRVKIREGGTYDAWMKLDLEDFDRHGNHKINQFHENYGFDINKKLNELPLVELEHEAEKDHLVESLERGNRQSAMLNLEKGERRVFLEANPQFKSIDMYDEKSIRLQYVNDPTQGGLVERLWPVEDHEKTEREQRRVNQGITDRPVDTINTQKKSGRKREAD